MIGIHIRRFSLEICIASCGTNKVSSETSTDNITETTTEMSVNITDEVTTTTLEENKKDIENDIYMQDTIIGLDMQPVSSKEILKYDDGFGYGNTAMLDGSSYIIDYKGETFTAEYKTDEFCEEELYGGENITTAPVYTKIKNGDRFGGLTVSDCDYKFIYSFYDGEVHTNHGSLSLSLSGEVTLDGVIARSENENDSLWNFYRNEIVFFPYAKSLQKQEFPLLHSESIHAVYHDKDGSLHCFLGETLPFTISNTESANIELPTGCIFAEASVTFRDIKQEWCFNGSGWQPCEAEVVNIEWH